MQTELANSLPADATARGALRHMLATLAYRAAKVLRDVPPDFGSMTFGTATRQPIRIALGEHSLLEAQPVAHPPHTRAEARVEAQPRRLREEPGDLQTGARQLL